MAKNNLKNCIKGLTFGGFAFSQQGLMFCFSFQMYKIVSLFCLDIELISHKALQSDSFVPPDKSQQRSCFASCSLGIQ